MAERYVVGARASRLSLAQADLVISKLKRAEPGSEYEVRTITTRGDVDRKPLFSMDRKGIFEKEIDRAVAQGEVDFAVHSLKDVPSSLEDGLALACVPERAQPNDVFVPSDGSSSLDSIRPGATVGTSSLRRAVQVSRRRPDLTVRPIRGNVETRIRRVLDGEYDAAVLAHAGIARLGMDVRFSVLPVDEFVPSPGQGAIAVVARAGGGGGRIMRALKRIEDGGSRQAVQAERALSDFVDSGCRFPVGAYARPSGPGMLTLAVAAFSIDGRVSLRASRTGDGRNAELLGRLAGGDLLRQGVRDLALNWRRHVEEWNRT